MKERLFSSAGIAAEAILSNSIYVVNETGLFTLVQLSHGGRSLKEYCCYFLCDERHMTRTCRSNTLLV
jgi:hypothetical protein